MDETMKKIYFAGKFSLTDELSRPLAERLRGDYRARLLGDPKKLVLAQEGLELPCGVIYAGPFYCEEASKGAYTSTDCRAVLAAEYRAVEGCDVYVAFFDRSFSVGTVVELGWALQMKKEIVICYRIERSAYDISSEYWFAIANAQAQSDRVRVFGFHSLDEAVKKLLEGEFF